MRCPKCSSELIESVEILPRSRNSGSQSPRSNMGSLTPSIESIQTGRIKYYKCSNPDCPYRRIDEDSSNIFNLVSRARTRNDRDPVVFGSNT